MSRSDLIPYGALLLRIALGALFLAHGLLKLLVHKPAGTAAYFRSLGLPGFVGYLTMAAELGGGTLLILGIATSLVALALVPLILGTIYMVHGSKSWLFTNVEIVASSLPSLVSASASARRAPLPPR